MSAGFDVVSTPQPGDGAEPTAPSSIMERLQAQTIETVKAQTKNWPVPAREGFEVAYCMFLAPEEWDLFWQRHEGDQRGLITSILVHQCRGLVMDGEPVTNAAGQPLTFRDPELQAMVGARDAHDAVAKLYIQAGHAHRTGLSVIAYCGWDLARPLDPTQP